MDLVVAGDKAMQGAEQAGLPRVDDRLKWSSDKQSFQATGAGSHASIGGAKLTAMIEEVHQSVNGGKFRLPRGSDGSFSFFTGEDNRKHTIIKVGLPPRRLSY